MHIFYTTEESTTNSVFSEIKIVEKQLANLPKGVHLIKESSKNRKSNTKYFKERKELIDSADCIIAEGTFPSTAIGGEIVYALMKNKPVLVLLYKEEIDKISPMLLGNPSENIFIEHYDKNNISYLINKFINHVTFNSRRKGKLVVIDGGDGSGKATQVKLVTKKLKEKKYMYRVYDFPRYYTSFHGKIVGKMLNGDFGSLDTLSPYLASLAYALDRASVKEEMDDYLLSGGLILCNRYATSNMAHWGNRFKTKKESDKYLSWIYELEYKVHKIPKEDLVIYLYVPWQIGMELTQKKSIRSYVKGKKMDIVEKDIEYRIKSEEMFLYLCEKYKHWKKIDCTNNKGIMYSKEYINSKIMSILKKEKILK
jgi:dTMP kinase